MHRTLGIASLVFVFCLSTVALDGHEGPPNTLVPFTAPDFIGDPVIGRQLSDLAEFAIHLLQWTETDRSVARLQRSLKGKVGSFYRRWNGTATEAPALEEIVRFTSESYESLSCPQLTKIEVGSAVTLLEAPAKLDLLGFAGTEVPVIVRNSSPNEVSVTIGSGSEEVEVEPRIVRLRGGETQGAWLIVSPIRPEASELVLAVDAGAVTGRVSVPARVRNMSRLRVKVVDESGLPTPARVYLTGADDKRHTPDEIIPRITSADYGQPYGGEYYFYTDSGFSVNLPEGETQLEVIKGLEYAPFSTTFQMPASGQKEIVARLDRPYNMAAKGWYSGDTHIHPNLFSDTRIRPQDVLRITKAEDLNVPHLLACNDTDGFITDLVYFEGKPNRLSEKNYILYWNQEMRNLRVYGHMAFLKLKEFVHPSYVGWPRTDQPYDYPPNYHLAAAAKQQGAAVIQVHPGLPQEYPVDIALGVVDTIDVMCQGNEEKNTADWYRLLNSGFRCGISAGTDCFLNVPYHLLAGAGRVYVKTGTRLTYDKWIQAYLEGRSFASNAPLLEFSVDSKGAGEEIRWSSGSKTVRVKADAVSHVPMRTMEVVVNGKPVYTVEATDEGLRASLSREIQLEESAWIAVRVRGDAHRMVPNDTELYAHTSPVYCYRDGSRIHFREDALYFVGQIDRLLERVDANGVFKDAAQKQKVVDLFRKGQDVYRKIAGEATR